MVSKSNRWLRGLALGGLMLAAGLAFTPSAAQARIYVNIGIPLPFIAPPPVVYAPPRPVYVPPVAYPPVYAVPAPVYGHVVYGHPWGWYHHHHHHHDRDDRD